MSSSAGSFAPAVRKPQIVTALSITVAFFKIAFFKDTAGMLVNKKWFLVIGLVGGLVAALGMFQVANAGPLNSGSLSVSATMSTGTGSRYNPRSAGGKNYVVGLNTYLTSYVAGSSVAENALTTTTEHRMTTSFNAGGTDYVLSSGGASSSTFTLRDYSDLTSKATATSS